MRPAVYYFAPFQLDVRECRLLCHGRPIPLRAKVFDTLCLLVERSGHLVRRDELMSAIWPDATVDENNLEHNLSVLRKVFRQNHPEENFIETVSGKGYRFVAEVRRVNDGPEAFRLVQKGDTNVRSQSSRPRLRGQSSRGARRDGELRGQAVRPFVVEDDELRRLARELQCSAGPLLATIVSNVDRIATEQNADHIAALLSEANATADELTRQLRAHLLPVTYLTRQHAVCDFFTNREYEFGYVEALPQMEKPCAANRLFRKVGAG